MGNPKSELELVEELLIHLHTLYVRLEIGIRRVSSICKRLCRNTLP